MDTYLRSIYSLKLVYQIVIYHILTNMHPKKDEEYRRWEKVVGSSMKMYMIYFSIFLDFLNEENFSHESQI